MEARDISRISYSLDVTVSPCHGAHSKQWSYISHRTHCPHITYMQMLIPSQSVVKGLFSRVIRSLSFTAPFVAADK